MKKYNFERFTCIIQKNGKITGIIPEQVQQQCNNAGLIWFSENRVVMIDFELHKVYRDYWKRHSEPGKALHPNIGRISIEFDLGTAEDLGKGIWCMLEHYQYLCNVEKIMVEIEPGEALLPEPEGVGQHIDIRLIDVMYE